MKCEGGQPPKLCPQGTLRDDPSATSVDDCEPCPEGYYCPDPYVTGIMNYHCLNVLEPIYSSTILNHNLMNI